MLEGVILLCYFAICGWAGEASFGDEGLAHLALSTIFNGYFFNGYIG